METSKTTFFNQKKLLSLTTKIIFSYLLIQSLNIITFDRAPSNHDLDYSETESTKSEFKLSRRLTEEISWNTNPNNIVAAILELREKVEENTQQLQLDNSAIQDLIERNREFQVTQQTHSKQIEEILKFIQQTQETLAENEKTLMTLETIFSKLKQLNTFEEIFKKNEEIMYHCSKNQEPKDK